MILHTRCRYTPRTGVIYRGDLHRYSDCNVQACHCIYSSSSLDRWTSGLLQRNAKRDGLYTRKPQRQWRGSAADALRAAVWPNVSLTRLFVFQATNRSSNCQKEGPCSIARALHQIKFELEAPNGTDATPSRRGLGERHIAVEVDIEKVVRPRTGGPRWWPPRRPRGRWRARRSPRGRSRPRRRRGGRARSGGLRHARSGRSRL